MHFERFLLLGALISSFAAAAADDRTPLRELWAGTYKCSANEADPDRWPAYDARIQLRIEGGTARISKESARIRETMTGRVAEDGSLKLEGGGAYKDAGGPGWRYRFDGRFDDGRFSARGMMLSPGMGTKLRDCSMALARIALPRQAQAPRAAPAPPATATVEASAAPAVKKNVLPSAVQEALLPPFHAAVNRIDGPDEKSSAGADGKGKEAPAASTPSPQPFWRDPIVWSAVILGVALVGVGLVAYSRRPRRIFRS